MSKELPPKETVAKKVVEGAAKPKPEPAAKKAKKAKKTKPDVVKDKTDYSLKVIETITINYLPTVVICAVDKDVEAGRYYISNITDVVIVQKLMIIAGFVEYDGNGRIEVVVVNLVDEWFPISTDFTIAKLVPS